MVPVILPKSAEPGVRSAVRDGGVPCSMTTLDSSYPVIAGPGAISTGSPEPLETGGIGVTPGMEPPVCASFTTKLI